MTVKKQLYEEVIDLFDRGQTWEHGIPLCKELCQVYEDEVQYDNLAATLVSHSVVHVHTILCTYVQYVHTYVYTYIHCILYVFQYTEVEIVFIN